MASSLPPPPVCYPVSWRQAAIQSLSSNFLLNVDTPHKEPPRPGGRLSIWTSHVLGDKNLLSAKANNSSQKFLLARSLNSQYLPQLQFLLSPHYTGLMETSLLKEGPYDSSRHLWYCIPNHISKSTSGASLPAPNPW